jgi:DNA-binding SARP family transcriptional activator
MVRFHALGSVTITEQGRELAVGGPRQRRLVAMLLIHRNAVVSVDRLADVVFEGEPTPAASTTLPSYVARVRRVIDGAERIAVVTHGERRRCVQDGVGGQLVHDEHGIVQQLSQAPRRDRVGYEPTG